MSIHYLFVSSENNPFVFLHTIHIKYLILFVCQAECDSEFECMYKLAHHKKGKDLKFMCHVKCIAELCI